MGLNAPLRRVVPSHAFKQFPVILALFPTPSRQAAPPCTRTRPPNLVLQNSLGDGLTRLTADAIEFEFIAFSSCRR